MKKLFLGISQNSQEKTLAQVFSCEFCKISKDTFSYRTPPVASFVLTITIEKQKLIITGNQ